LRVLVTGAGGHIGSAVVPELIDGGHQVVGLARSNASITAIGALGAEARRGDINDPDVVRDAAQDVDAVVHLAFDNDAALAGDLAGAASADLAVIEAFGETLAGTGKAFVGVGLSATGDEDIDAMIAQNPRSKVSTTIKALAERNIRSVLISVPPVVHSSRDRIGFVPTLINIARRTGSSGYIGDGSNLWPAVNTQDLGRLFRLAVEDAPAGAQLLGAAEGDVSTRTIAEAIGRQLDIPVVRVAADAALGHFGSFAMIMALDFPPMTSQETRAMLGWWPTHRGLIADLEEGHYFTAS
jgi:nucleoside-diphosphate-sugar epimerase